MNLQSNPYILTYLEEADVESPEYVSFFEKYHGDRSFLIWSKKIHWYYKSGNYRILVAKYGRSFIGQCCAYKVRAIIDGEEQDLWWGVDAFVLDMMRGKGIGKMLQKRLHEDLPNFSSASYSRLNGIIKRKCGAKEFLDFGFSYYPVSCYFSLLIELAIKKILSRNVILPRIRLPFVYWRLNGIRQKRYTVKELPNEELPGLSHLMEGWLKDEPFHVVRSYNFIQWKYNENPLIHYHVLAIMKQDEQVGIVVISDVFDGTVAVSKMRIAKVYDSVIKPGSKLSQKQIIQLAIAYLRKRHVKIDGVMSLQKVNYWPRFIYPYPASHMLSTINHAKLTSGYITYIDQDMERMI